MPKSLKNLCFFPTYKSYQTSLTTEFLTGLLSLTDTITIVTDQLFNSEFFELCRYLIFSTNHNAQIRLLILPVITESQFDDITRFESEKEMAEETINSLFERCKTIDFKPYIDTIRQLCSERKTKIKINLKNIEELEYGKIGNYLIFEGSCNEVVSFSLGSLMEDSGISKIEVKWSWGDPTNSVQKIKKQVALAWEGKKDKGLVLEIEKDLLLKKLGTKKLSEKLNKIVLWKHQEKAINNWAKNRYQGILKMCTGAGKTITALAAIERLQNDLNANSKELNVVVVAAPRKILVEQWSKEVKKFGFKNPPLLAYDNINTYANRIGIALNHKRHYGLCIVITTYDTFCDDRFKHKIIQASKGGTVAMFIADEMHNLSSSKSRKRIREYGEYFKFRLGLSATPEIEKNERATSDLFDYFGPLLSEYNISDAINDKVLCPYKYYPVPAFLDKKTSLKYFEILNKIQGEKSININIYRQRGDLLRRSEVYLEALQEILNTSFEENDFYHTLTFCPPGKDSTDQDVRLIQKVKKIFQDRNVICSSITQKTNNNERIETLRLFKKGFFKVLLAIGCLDEGFDLPSTRSAIMLYSVDRERQFVQRRGRVLRRFEGKKYAKIYDVLILPYNTDLNPSDAKRIITKEMRRYSEFSKLAMNEEEARKKIHDAIRLATER